MLLNVEKLCVTYRYFEMHELSLTMDHGEILTVIGESGSGKTTLAKAICCLLGEEARVHGKVELNGVDLMAMPERQRKKLRMKEFSISFQNAAQYLNPTLTLRGHLEEVLDRQYTRKEQPDRMAELLEQVGLSREDLGRYPKELSGGMAQKFLLACAVALEPKLVVLDEPTGALDHRSAEEFVDLIRKLNQEKGIAFLVITHDMRLAQQLKGRMVVLYEGHILEQGRADMILDRPRHPYTRGLLGASISLNLARDIWGIPPAREHSHHHGCPFYGRCTQATERCGMEAPELRLDETGCGVACHLGGIVRVLEGKGIAKSFGKQQVLAGCDLEVYSGEIVSLVGKSGAGKTTLARIVGGFEETAQGQVLFEGEPANFEKLLRSKGGIQMVFQDSDSALNPRMSVFEAVSEPLLLSGTDLMTRTAAVRGALRDVGLTAPDMMEMRIRSLSGGQKQRICLARALTMEPKLLIADEPTSMLDPSSCANVLRMLKSMQNLRGISMLIITHDLDSAAKISDGIYLLKQGRLTRIRPSDYVDSSLSGLLDQEE